MNPSIERRFTVRFSGDRTIRTTVTSTASVVRKWIWKSLQIHRYLRHKLVVGLGVQWRAPYDTSASTLQLCIGSRCLIYQLRHAGYIPRSLERFLAHPDFTFVGVQNHRDAQMLQEHDLEVDTLLDLCRIAAESRGLRGNLSMEDLAERVLGYSGISKSFYVGMSNWNAELLSDEQVQYASVDAAVSFLLGVELEAWRWN
ncbi:Exonuclease 3'-5' domain-containing protein 2 [Linum grandiflorum]